MLFPVGLVGITIGGPEMHEHGNLVQLRLLQLLNLEGSTVREGLAVFDFAVFEECRFERESAHVFQRFLYHRQQDLPHKCTSMAERVGIKGPVAHTLLLVLHSGMYVVHSLHSDSMCCCDFSCRL
jgi:hypothetical protein